jgi:hypothetical protein
MKTAPEHTESDESSTNGLAIDAAACRPGAGISCLPRLSLVSLMLNWHGRLGPGGHPAYKIISLHGASDQSSDSVWHSCLALKLKIFALPYG